MSSVKAKEVLHKMIKGKEAGIYSVGHNKYGKAIANIYLDRESVNKKILKKVK